MLNENIIKKATGVDICMPEEDNELEKEIIQFTFDVSKPSKEDETVTKNKEKASTNNAGKLKWGIVVIAVVLIILYLNK